MLHRIEKVQEKIREIVSQLFVFDIQDPRLRGLTITRVLLTRDMGLARIYYEALGTEERSELANSLQKVIPFVRRSLAGKLKLRLMPKIEFFYDETSEEVKKVEELFARL